MKSLKEYNVVSEQRLNSPNPALNEKERELLDPAPEECLQHAIRRGALSLDQVTERLSPRVAAVVRCIVTGERTPELAEREEIPWSAGRRSDLSMYPQLGRTVDEEILTLAEAFEAVRTIDSALGRYPTGAKYAAP